MVKHLKLYVCFTENHTKLLLFEGLMLISKTNLGEQSANTFLTFCCFMSC